MKGERQRAVIVSAQRSGGLFLAGCLSNHKDIHCPREEPFRRQAIWQQRLKLKPAALLDFVLSEPYYRVRMCRLTYDQAFHPELRAYLLANKVKIIHLTRAVLPTVTSTLLAKSEIASGQPRHVLETRFPDEEVLDVGPEDVLKRIQHLLGQRKRYAQVFSKTDQLGISYEAMTGGGKEAGMLPSEVTVQIYRFLDVPYAQMGAANRKMHRRPISSYYSRWPEIRAAIRARFPEALEEAKAWMF